MMRDPLKGLLDQLEKLRGDVDHLLRLAGGSKEPWFDYSDDSTIVGFTGTLTTKVIYIHRDPQAKTVDVVAFLAGTSNSTTLTFTVPADCATAVTTSVMCPVIDNGVRTHGAASVGGTTVSVFKDLFQAFTASGNKEVRLSMRWFIP